MCKVIDLRLTVSILCARCDQNLFKSQNAASLSFGAMVALSGFIGTALGGILLDRLQIRDWNSSVSRFRLRQSQGEGSLPSLTLQLQVFVVCVGRTDTGLSLSGPIILDDDDYEEAHDLTTSPNGEPSRMLLDSKLCASTQFSAISIAIGFVFCLLSPLVASALYAWRCDDVCMLLMCLLAFDTGADSSPCLPSAAFSCLRPPLR